MNIFGKFDMRAVFITLPALLQLLVSCGGSENKTENISSGNTEGIRLTNEQVKVAGLTFGKIEKHLLSFDIHAKGKVILPPQNDASVSAITACSVEKIHVIEGDAVKKGELLATIISPAIIQVQQDFVSSASKLDLLKKEFERQKLLNQEKISADKKFQEIQAEWNDAQSRYESLKIQLELLNISPDNVKQGKISQSAGIISPVAGFVEEVMVNVGHYVSPEEPLFRIINRDRLYIELMVFEKDVPFIKKGQRVTFELANLGGEEYEARLLSIGHSVEENARTVKAIAELNNPPAIVLPGMFVSAEIHTDEQYLDALPEEAVVSEDGNSSWVYYTITSVSAGELEFRKAAVRTGFREEGFMQVEPLIQIPSEARIVIKGAYFIKAEGLKQKE